jgi:drug/metabolite transporter (DMT)-like permease
MSHNIFFILGLIAAASICDTLREIFLKTAINSLQDFSPNNVKKVVIFIFKLIRIPLVWISFICSVLSLFFYLFVLSKVDLNFAFSLDSMHYIFIAFASRFLLKEKVNSYRWVGTFFIVVGITLVTLSK